MAKKNKTMDELHEEFRIIGLSYQDFKQHIDQDFSDYETIELFKIMLKKLRINQ